MRLISLCVSVCDSRCLGVTHRAVIVLRYFFFYTELDLIFRLSEYVQPPTLVSEISWVETCWPKNLKRVGNNPKPAVMKYCLIGTENSYTDFHIDFGGSSVWYHVLQVIEPIVCLPVVCQLPVACQWVTSGSSITRQSFANRSPKLQGRQSTD